MSQWLFQTVVTSSLLYQNHQLNELDGILGEIADGLRSERQSAQYLSMVREKVYLVRRGAEGLEPQLDLKPHQGYFYAKTIEKFFGALGVGTATFHTFDDKRFFDETVSLVDRIRQRAHSLLGPDQARAVELYIHAEQVVPLLESYLPVRKAHELLSNPAVRQILDDAEQAKRDLQPMEFGCGLGCGILFVACGGALFFLFFGISEWFQVRGERALMFWFFALAVGFCLLLSWGVRRLNSQNASKLAAVITQRDLELTKLGHWQAFYALKITDEEVARCEREKAEAELKPFRVNVARDVAQLEIETNYLKSVILSGRKVLLPVNF